MTPTDEERLRVLRAAGFREIAQYSTYWTPPHDVEGSTMTHHYDLTRDDYAAKYLLPIAEAFIAFIKPTRPGWEVYTYEDIEWHFRRISGHGIEGDTFGEALRAFVLALLDAGVIPEVSE